MCIGHGILLLVWRSSASNPDVHFLASIGNEHITWVEAAARDGAFRDEGELETAPLITETEEGRLEVRVILQ